MPNWCRNSMTVTGPKEVLDAFVAKAKGFRPRYRPHRLDVLLPDSTKEPKENLLEFNQFLPVPEELLQRNYGNEEQIGKPVDGCMSGYDWEAHNWGCKWGACDVQFERPDDETARYEFDTAWSPPVELLRHIATMPEFEELVIQNEYSEPGMGFEGSTYVKDGECHDECDEILEDEE